MPSDDVKLEVLHAHYVDSFGQIRNTIKLRDRIFAFIVIIITFLLLRILSPEETDEIARSIAAQKFGIADVVAFKILSSVLWFVTLALLVRYFQAVIWLERQYNYIHTLEEKLASIYDGIAFTREGKSYLEPYPLFSKWSSMVYTRIFPAMLFLILSCSISKEAIAYGLMDSVFLLDAAMYTLICISIVTYSASIHFKK